MDFFRWFGSPQPVFVDSRSTVVFFCLLISGPIFCHFFSRRSEVFGQNTGCLVLTQRGRRGREGIPVLYHEMHCPTADCVHRAHHVDLLHGFPLTQPVSIPISNPAANVGIVRSAGVQAGGETREPRMGASEPKIDVASVTPIVPTETRVDDLEEQPTSFPPPPQPAQAVVQPS